MSRVAKSPILLPQGVDVKIGQSRVDVRGPKGELTLNLHPSVSLEREENEIRVRWQADRHIAMAGTFRALVNNMVTGVSRGFEKKLQLVGIGFRAQLQGDRLNLSLGYSHPVDYQAPDGITIETPNQTEIVISGCDKQKVGQVAAEIRAFRPPEPYKGKGVRYAEERVVRKEAKKA